MGPRRPRRGPIRRTLIRMVAYLLAGIAALALAAFLYDAVRGPRR